MSQELTKQFIFSNTGAALTEIFKLDGLSDSWKTGTRRTHGRATAIYVRTPPFPHEAASLNFTVSSPMNKC